LPDAQISAADFAVVTSLNPVTHFLPAARASDLSMLPSARNSNERFPLLRFWCRFMRLVKLGFWVQSSFSWTEQYRREFRALDHKLLFQAAAAFFAVVRS